MLSTVPRTSQCTEKSMKANGGMLTSWWIPHNAARQFWSYVFGWLHEKAIEWSPTLMRPLYSLKQYIPKMTSLQLSAGTTKQPKKLESPPMILEVHFPARFIGCPLGCELESRKKASLLFLTD